METRSLLLDRINEYQKTAIVSDSIINGSRLYVTPEGNSYPSVTTVLSAMEDHSWLDAWRERVGVEEAARITKQSAERGTSMHALIENRFRGEPIDQSAVGYSLYRQLKIYLQNIDPIGLELPLWSDILRIAGRTDCAGIYGTHGICIIDYKSSRREKRADEIEGYFLQTALYAAMLSERLNIHAKKIVILIGVDGGFPQEFVRHTKEYLPKAISIVKMYHKLNSFL